MTYGFTEMEVIQLWTETQKFSINGLLRPHSCKSVYHG